MVDEPHQGVVELSGTLREELPTVVVLSHHRGSYDHEHDRGEVFDSGEVGRSGKDVVGGDGAASDCTGYAGEFVGDRAEDIGPLDDGWVEKTGACRMRS